MTPAAALVSGCFVLLAALAPEELLRRGYELLPDARWREELQKDREGFFLGGVLLSQTLSVPNPLPPDFELIDYDSRDLYPEEARSVRVDLKLRADPRFWADFPEFYNWWVFRRDPSEPW
jgi:hypothetical protein